MRWPRSPLLAYLKVGHLRDRGVPDFGNSGERWTRLRDRAASGDDVSQASYPVQCRACVPHLPANRDVTVRCESLPFRRAGQDRSA
jgi:hypothetical protein